MENASKALLMAGGILIAILVIGVVIYMFNSSSFLFKSSEDIERAEQIEAFNREYEAYNRKLMRGTDIISIINKVNSNNEKYEDIPEYQMSVKFKLIETIEYKDINGNDKTISKNTTYTISSKNEPIWKEIRGTEEKPTEAFTEFKRRVFDCISVKYNKQTGRISSMEFIERDVGNI